MRIKTLIITLIVSLSLQAQDFVPILPAWFGAVSSNSCPTADSITLHGSFNVYSTVYVTYAYHDHNGDLEGQNLSNFYLRLRN